MFGHEDISEYKVYKSHAGVIIGYLSQLFYFNNF